MVRSFEQTLPASLSLARPPQKSVYVNFTNRGLSKVVKKSSSLRPSTSDRVNVAQVSKLLRDVKVARGTPVGFRSIQEFIGIDYVGYIIEKQRLDRATGDWLPIDEYRIIGSSAANFKDSRVAYGVVYRYRIKSIIKVTVKKKKVSYETLELTEDVKRFEKEQIKEALKSRETVLANIDRITNLGLQKKVSSGKSSTVFDLLSGLKLKSTDERTELIRSPITFPVNQAQDLRRLKNLRIQDADLLRGAIPQERLQKIINTTLKPIEEEVVEYESFYYESRPSKTWLIVNVTERVPPPPPSAIKIVPNSTKGEVCISWLPPANSQRDIKEVRLYKRSGLNQRWRLLLRDQEVDVDKDGNVDEGLQARASVPVADGFFIDTRVAEGQKYIYALTSVDIHGMESFLSAQIQVELNPNFDIEKKEKDLKWISGSGAKLSEVNAVFKTFLEPEDPVVAKENVTLTLKPSYNETDKRLLVRVTSLDTHEQKEFNVILNNVNLDELQR